MAAWLAKPLYPITCGDLGTTAQEVENNLYKISAQAEAWDCVLLPDETDVFLAQRSKSELKRNAIVSVFLCILEYYKGLLFLTTNRVGSFDEAFISRIHLSLYYPGLNKSQNLAIWEMNLEKTQNRKGPAMEIEKNEILQWANEHFVENTRNGTADRFGMLVRPPSCLQNMMPRNRD
ncbi:hypothetical protein VTN77DRAFT_4514 [Rasamsonia byssochlamydoides]|uniref:uncharacterized protein n=1 Tax=Rasamsonia byssochlamydoides TaxID=89139 RepID=UPI003742E4A6